MKKLPHHMEDTILDYLDGNLTDTQRDVFEKLMDSDPDLRARMEEIRLTDQALRLQTPEHPSKNFTAVVMARLDNYPARSGLSVRSGIFLLLGSLSVMAIAMMLVSAGVFDETATFDLNNITIAQRYIKQTLPSIPIDGKLLVNAIILMNMVLAFVVLDRAILRPLFQKRLQAGH
jgi:anti-sigma factor RsiW